MAKRKEESNSVLPEDILAKLKETKNELLKEEQRLSEEKEAQRLFERKEREKNLSFAELLERHGDQGNKF
ncbi:hypothetical protein A1A1_09056 [Planococcus antarcticus DSM 14505]|uniref:DUF3886 domain-containing protein n=1 Tax=Planococcus antarcticus DSM 14505 TaxID=1185653 RepID=A0A1C7DGC4_9BACL|nr:YqkE family protein [Planococcus antarcticus]ANU10609.1 hypothetical protein BBH88_09955 [Planococcus antarcticus DSM 14505]EIM06691.1 hypothetical protein A1A1_09056 [Planococcus antarcticus DSM 14505]